MAIAFDVVSSGTSTASASGLSWSHTCTGSNRKLFVSTWTTAASTTGVTYNSVAMTLIAAQTQAGLKFSLWYLDSPATGSNTVATTFSAGSNVGAGCSSSYTGCATGIDNNTTAASGTTSISAALTPTVNGCWIVFGVGGGSNTAYSSGNGSTSVTVASNDANGGRIFADTGAAINPATSTTMQINAGVASNMAGVVASFAPLGGTASFRRTLLGVGV